MGIFLFTGCHSRKVAKPVVPLTKAAAAVNREPSIRNKEYNEISDLKTVHFDYDSSSIRPRDANILKKNYDVIVQHPDWEFLIEGNCDERGTEAYNLGLGQRRAAAIRKYYMALGISGSRIATISYGKEKPLCAESSESCWRRNRRGDTKSRISEQASQTQ